MKEMQIKLTNIQDIRNFVNEVILADFEVDLLSPITMVAHTANAESFFAKMEKFKA